MHMPTWIVGPVMRVADLFFPKRPKLKIEVRQLCDDKIMASLEQDWGYSVHLYIFLQIWVVNLKETPTTIKESKLTVFTDGKSIQSEPVRDISKWHQHLKLEGQQHGLKVIRDEREKLDPLDEEPLQHGIPLEGWLCFLVQNTRDSLLDKAKIQLILVDSFGRRHFHESHSPWPCKGAIVNPEAPF
jgi:hypothetical protein